MKKGFRLA